MENLRVVMMSKGSNSQFYTVPEAARVLDVSPVTIWRWIEAGKLPAFRVGPRNIRVRRDELEAMIRPARAKGMAVESEKVQIGPATEEELARRKALVARILSKRKERVIAPLTTADLVRKVREGERRSYAR